jgi:hypothetical protein
MLNIEIGIFDDDKIAWLVCWELNIIIQFPAGCWIFLPSALISHFNADVGGKSLRSQWSQISIHVFPIADISSGLEVVITGKNEKPSTSSTQFRGSLAFFNPATFFSVVNSGYATVKAAVADGAAQKVRVNFAEKVDVLFPKIK